MFGCLRRLPGRSPMAALALGLAVLLVGPAAAQTVTREVEGLLSVQWGDPAPGRTGGATRFRLTTAEGVTLPLTITADKHTAAFQSFGRRVTVRGRAQPGLDGTQGVEVDEIVATEPALAPDPTAALKTRRILYVLLRFKGDAGTPHAPGFFRSLTNPKIGTPSLGIPATINGYFDKTSWGHLQWRADVVGVGGLTATNWLTLPKTKTGYANCGWDGVCADLDQIAADAMKLVKAQGVDPMVYENVNFVINNDLDCCAWGGGFVYGGKSFGATWEPPWGQETGTYIHELGHSIGLPHSGWVYYAYDSPWDDMSNGSAASYVQCGSYKSVNDGNVVRKIWCTEPGAGYITAHKDKLGWLPAANVVTVSAKGTRTVVLQANALPLGTAKKMVKICLPGQSCTGSTAHYLTVEARFKTVQYEKGMPNEGVIIHDFKANRGEIGGGNACFFNTQSGWAVPVDATPGDYKGAPDCNAGGRTYPNYALFNAQYGVGKVMNKPILGVKVEVLSKTASTYTVRVTRSK